MKRRLAAVCTAALFLPFLGTQGPAFAQQGPGMEHKGGAPMMGWQHGMGGWGEMGGCGPGMMGGEYGSLGLSRDQRNKIYAIHKDLRGKQFALMDRMHDSMQSVRHYRDGKFDEQAARNAYATAEKIHREMFENMLNAQKQADALLTPQQRQQLSQATQ
jgi:Spy/CpxP family protein refolding chaperone